MEDSHTGSGEQTCHRPPDVPLPAADSATSRASPSRRSTTITTRRSHLTPPVSTSRAVALTKPANPKQTTVAYAMVVSHDCEFNPGKRHFFLAARLDRMPHDARNDSTLIDELRAGNDYRQRSSKGNPIALDAFFLEPIPGVLDDEYGYVANFASITPFSMKFKKDLLRLKHAELEHSHREQLRAKLAIFFGRLAGDVSNDLKVDRPADPATLEWRDPPPDAQQTDLDAAVDR